MDGLNEVAETCDDNWVERRVKMSKYADLMIAV